MWFSGTHQAYVISLTLGNDIAPADAWWLCDSTNTPFDDYSAAGVASGDLALTGTPPYDATVT